MKAVVEVSALHGTHLALLTRTLFAFAHHIEPFLHPNADSARAECTVIESHQQEVPLPSLSLSCCCCCPDLASLTLTLWCRVSGACCASWCTGAVCCPSSGS